MKDQVIFGKFVFVGNLFIFIFRFLNMHPNLNKIQSIKNSSIFQKFIEKDETLKYYTYEGLYIISSKYNSIHCLKTTIKIFNLDITNLQKI